MADAPRAEKENTDPDSEHGNYQMDRQISREKENGSLSPGSEQQPKHKVRAGVIGMMGVTHPDHGASMSSCSQPRHACAAISSVY
jgi:hypothetical protein